MSRAATDRIKCNLPIGHLPALQYLLPAQLHVDDSYQRTLDTGPSQALVRKIAIGWNWDLCQPLVVARRDNGDLYVIDGQHRLAAARLRGDIMQMPAVVVQYADRSAEAASFVHLNQERRPLSKLDVFKAAVASGDGDANAISAAVQAAGLRIANTTNYDSWKPGQIANIGGIQACVRVHGNNVAAIALMAMARGFAGQVLRYAGTLFPGIAAVVALETKQRRAVPDEIWECLKDMIAGASQEDWRKEILAARFANPNLNFTAASAKVFTDAWAELLAEFLDEAA